MGSHLSIGEVLSLVQEEFPDVSISKIRFLEAQGLLDPERTPSGYRKFYEPDIDRLRWVLIQQRDNFLPLRVIKDRLDEWDRTGVAPDDLPVAPVPVGATATRPTPAESVPEPPAPADDADTQVVDVETTPPASAAAAANGAAPAVPPSASRAGADDPSFRAADDELPLIFRQSRDEDLRARAASLAAASAEEVPVPGAAPVVEPPPPPKRPAPRLDPPPSSADNAYTRDDLAARAGIDAAVIDELESFGLLLSRRVGPDTYYGGEALAVATACSSFLSHGVEARHLRMYKIAAEREAGFFEQLVMPLLKQRNPESREKAIAIVDELAGVGEALHAAVLRQILNSTFS